MSSERFWLIALPVALALAACSDSPRPYGDRTTTPPSSPAAKGEAPSPTPPANTAAPAPTAPAPSSATVAPKSEDVEEKKGSETGMVGGASGTAASGGKPGANMPSSGGAAQTTGEPTKANK